MQQAQERVPVTIVEEHEEIARLVARRIGAVIRAQNRSHQRTVLGLATGSTPVGVFRRLIAMHRRENLDFSNVVCFNLDEYYPMEPDSIHSFHRFMWENLFQHVNIPKANVHIPRGDLPRHQVEAHCREYEALIASHGGIDFQILGIGKTGHIGFNEPGSGRDSRTRLVSLDNVTRRDAAADFFGEENVPRQAITMGVATIMEAREIVLMATGEHKAPIIRRAVEGPVSHDVAATFLQEHPNTTFYLDMAAAGDLTRVMTPWLVSQVDWTPELITRAVIWLSRQNGTAILKLSDKDYSENNLSPLLTGFGSADCLNEDVFSRLGSRIRDRPELPRERRIIVFSPHPDDDVISMGGTLRKLHDNGNSIVIAYMTSGNIAVFDHEVRRYLDFMQRFHRDVLSTGEGHLGELGVRIHQVLNRKQPGDVDIPEVQDIKRQIREAEAVSAVESLGIPREACRFLNLPFYQTGKVRKDPVGPEDIRIVRDLLEDVEPDLLFVAGDLSDPHGTHRMCKEAIEKALEQYPGRGPDVWLYRGAWQEWGVHEADVLVPLSRAELRQKIFAIFKHQSQKDVAPFPGPYDDREFWQRVAARNTGTAQEVDQLGLPEYHAMEAFVVCRAEDAVCSGEKAREDVLSGTPPGEVSSGEDSGKGEPEVAGEGLQRVARRKREERQCNRRPHKGRS